MEALGIDTKLLLAQGINFLAFMFIFQKFLYKPFTEYLRKERKNEAEKARLLSELQTKEEKLEKKEKDILDDARAQALEIMKKAEENAAKKKKDILKKGQEEVVAMKAKAQKDLEDQKAKLYDEVKGHVVKTSETLTTTVLKDFFDASSQKDMLNHIFKQLKKSKVYEN